MKHKSTHHSSLFAAVSAWLSRHAVAFVISVIALVVVLVAAAMILFSTHSGEAKWFYLPATATSDSVRDSLRSSLGSAEGDKVYMLWRLQGGTPQAAHGAYLVEPGQSLARSARRMVKGAQTPIRLSFNNIRTLPQLAERVAARLECPSDSFITACRDVLPQAGFGPDEFPAAFIPDTYEMYWTSSPRQIVTRLLDYRNRFWNDQRRAKAAELNITPVQAAVIASIVEEETTVSDERPLVARLYLNRLSRGMKLQADPTVKFATGDFSLRRINASHLAIQSPYNTYLNPGLPPGPIRVAEASAIDAVLNAPDHDYIYMCARDDFSGRHNFATDYPTHLANARRYREALDKRGIH